MDEKSRLYVMPGHWTMEQKTVCRIPAPALESEFAV